MLTVGVCLGMPNSTETLISWVSYGSPTAGCWAAGGFDCGKNGLSDMGEASRYFILPVRGRTDGGGGVVVDMARRSGDRPMKGLYLIISGIV